MARTKINFPEYVDFTTEYTVVIGDINRADHLAAEKLFGIVVEAQLRFISDLGYADSSKIDGADYIMADSEVVYRSESKYGDEMRIDVAVCNFGSKSFELLYRLYNCTKNRDAAYVKAGMLCFDYSAGKVIDIPDSFRQRFSRD